MDVPADGYCDYLSRQWFEYTGRPAEEQLGLGWADAVHPDDRARVEVEWGLAVQRGDLYDEEFRLRRHDGAYRWFRTRGVPLRDATGALVKWFGSNTDVEDYKQSEQRLRAQLERLDLLDRLTRAISEHQDLHGVLQVVVRSLEDHLPLDYCCICLYDAVDRTLSVACIGPSGEALGASAWSRREGDGAHRPRRPVEVPPRPARLRTRHQRAAVAVRAATVERRHPLVRRLAARRREQRLRRA